MVIVFMITSLDCLLICDHDTREMQYKLIIPEKQCMINKMRTNLFPKKDFDSSLNPKRKPKSQGEAKVLNFGRRYNI
jgi:hypothetical protein